MNKKRKQEQHFIEKSSGVYNCFVMKKLIFVCGPAGIGKSTWSKHYAESHPDETVLVMAADEVRKDLYGGYDKFPNDGDMKHVYSELVTRIKSIVEKNESVTILLDTTMLYDKRRLYFRDALDGCFDEYDLVLLKLHDYRTCLVRNKKRIREKWVPESVILDMVSHYVDPSDSCKKKFDSVQEIYVD